MKEQSIYTSFKDIKNAEDIISWIRWDKPVVFRSSWKRSKLFYIPKKCIKKCFENKIARTICLEAFYYP